jgi:TonB family protein
MKFITCCWLLIALTGITALAQTHPKKKSIRKQTVVRRVMEKAPPPYSEQQYCIASLRSPDEMTVVPFDSTYIYTYVEQMPTLNGQPLQVASKVVIEQQIVVPPAAPDGRVFVGFEVTKTGNVRNIRILKGLRADLDSAVVTATRQLPRFTPGKQSGHVVVVRTVVPITIPVKQL